MELVVLNQEEVPVTTSRKVAEYFGKQHKNVLQNIKTITETLTEQGLDTELNFQPSEFKDPTGRTLPMFEMTRKGFMLLVMGFTGGKAIAMKHAFVDAFDAMEAELTKRNSMLPDFSNPEVLQKFLLEQTQQNIELQHKVAEDAPKVEAYDDFMETEGLG